VKLASRLLRPTIGFFAGIAAAGVVHWVTLKLFDQVFSSRTNVEPQVMILLAAFTCFVAGAVYTQVSKRRQLLPAVLFASIPIAILVYEFLLFPISIEGVAIRLPLNFRTLAGLLAVGSFALLFHYSGQFALCRVRRVSDHSGI